MKILLFLLWAIIFTVVGRLIDIYQPSNEIIMAIGSVSGISCFLLFVYAFGRK